MALHLEVGGDTINNLHALSCLCVCLYMCACALVCACLLCCLSPGIQWFLERHTFISDPILLVYFIASQALERADMHWPLLKHLAPQEACDVSSKDINVETKGDLL